MCEYKGYRYTVASIANGAQPRTVEAELWYVAPDAERGRWCYFRRCIAETEAEAARRVEADFREWVEGHQEAEPGP